jgi:hypothetical protein
MLLASALASVVALASGLAAGSWLGRRAMTPERDALRSRVRELSERLAAAERIRSSRLSPAERTLRGQAPPEAGPGQQPGRGPRTVH